MSELSVVVDFYSVLEEAPNLSPQERKKGQVRKTFDLWNALNKWLNKKQLRLPKNCLDTERSVRGRAYCIRACRKCETNGLIEIQFLCFHTLIPYALMETNGELSAIPRKNHQKFAESITALYDPLVNCFLLQGKNADHSMALEEYMNKLLGSPGQERCFRLTRMSPPSNNGFTDELDMENVLNFELDYEKQMLSMTESNKHSTHFVKNTSFKISGGKRKIVKTAPEYRSERSGTEEERREEKNFDESILAFYGEDSDFNIDNMQVAVGRLNSLYILVSVEIKCARTADSQHKAIFDTMAEAYLSHVKNWRDERFERRKQSL